MTADDHWLVAIDLQHVFGDPDSPWGSGEFSRAVAGTRALLPAFVGRTVLTRFVAPAEPAGAWVPYYAGWPFALVRPDDPLYALVPGSPASMPRSSPPQLSGSGDPSWRR